MPSADVVVVGAGLAGLACAVRLAEGGARVVVVAAGEASLPWAAGPLDVAAPAGAATPRDGIIELAATAGHPYVFLAGDVAPALTWFGALVAGEGLPYDGGLDAALRPLPTGLGALRPAAVAPRGMGAGLAPWGPGERLVVVGLGGFKDLWPAAVAAGLRRAFAAGESPGPDEVGALVVEIPELARRRSLTGPDLARALDQRPTRTAVLGRLADALARHGAGARRVALPAVLGLDEHAAVMAEATTMLGGPVLELPLVPPSVPGLRLQAILRRTLLRLGGRILLGEAVTRVEGKGGRVTRVVVPAAAREVGIATGRLVLATGGLAGGGVVAGEDGRLRETVLGLPVSGPPRGEWLAADAFAAGGHPVAASGISTDERLRPLVRPGDAGSAAFRDVWVAGSLLAGQRYVRERCGDGVALASAWRAAAEALA